MQTELEHIEILERLRWDGIVKSPFDASSRVYTCRHGHYKCKNTGKYFNVKTNTIFHNTRIPLEKWFLAIDQILVQPDKNASMLANELNLSIKTSSSMLKKIKKVLNREKIQKDIATIPVIVEPDKLSMSVWMKVLKSRNEQDIRE